MFLNKIVPRGYVALSIRRVSSNASSDAKISYFDLFPQSFPKHGPPQDSFLISPKSLRREFRSLQSQHHPDTLIGSRLQSNTTSKLTGDFNKNDNDTSALLNHAFNTLTNPYLRIAHVIELMHPENLDITQDTVSKELIKRFQTISPEVSAAYKELLLSVLEAHEQLELASSEKDLDALGEETDANIEDSEKKINELLTKDHISWDDIMMEAIRLKYWMNIKNGILEWEPGKLVQITH